MKHISAFFLILSVLAFASCAHHDARTETSQTTTGTGYHK